MIMIKENLNKYIYEDFTPASISDFSRDEFIKMIEDSNAEFEKGNYKGEKELLEQLENLL